MHQFDAVQLRGGELAVVVQADRLHAFNTRVIAPLIPTSLVTPTTLLHPEISIGGTSYFVATEKMTTVRATDISNLVCSLSEYEYSIRRAIDFLIIGF